MRNILIAIGIGALTWAGLYYSRLLGLGESIVPGVFVMLLAYYALARRSFKAVEKIFNASAKALQSMPPKLELAVSTLESAYVHAPRQIGVRTQIDSQIGMLHFLNKDYNKALPYLSRARGFGHWMGTAMLAVIYYKKKELDLMRQTLEIVTKKGKKTNLAWSLKAYLLCQINERDAAQAVLIEGLKHTKDDAKVKENLLSLQNGKKLKMRAYKEQWYQFHLERPPPQYQQGAGMRPKLGKVARRGRW